MGGKAEAKTISLEVFFLDKHVLVCRLSACFQTGFVASLTFFSVSEFLSVMPTVDRLWHYDS